MPIRLRLGLSFAFVTLVLVATGAALFRASFRNGLERSLDSGLRPRYVSATHAVDTEIAEVSGSAHDLALPGSQDSVIQVFDPEGRLLASTREAGAAPVLARSSIRAAATTPTFVDVVLGRQEREPYRVFARRHNNADHRIVLVATSMESTNAAASRVDRGLLLSGSAAILIAGVGGWFLAAAALRPVEHMRRTAADLSAHDMIGRLPVPSARDEISALAVTMNGLLSRLQTTLARQREFVADASHELRTPLAVLQAELELAARPGRNLPELHEAVTRAVHETQRLAVLVQDLLFLARMDDRMRLPTEDTHVSQLLTDAAASMGSRAAAAQVDIDVRSRELHARVAPGLIRQAVDNLLTNAVRHSPPGATVTVLAEPDEDGITISVIDHGSGFPAGFAEDAFQRFRRVDESRSRTAGDGAGLGLAIVQAIARAHGGTAEVTSGAGCGAAVRLHIPCEVS